MIQVAVRFIPAWMFPIFTFIFMLVSTIPFSDRSLIKVIRWWQGRWVSVFYRRCIAFCAWEEISLKKNTTSEKLWQEKLFLHQWFKVQKILSQMVNGTCIVLKSMRWTPFYSYNKIIIKEVLFWIVAVPDNLILPSESPREFFAKHR